MSLPMILAVAVALLLLAVVAVGVRAHRARARPQTPITEAQARAHASPLTRSVLSVSPRPAPGGRRGADGSRHLPHAQQLNEDPRT
jgi:hypothetical protein